MPKNAKSERSIRIVSHWGDCVVFRDKNGNIVEIIKPGCQGQTKKRAEGKDNRIKPKVDEQVELFSANDYTGVKKYADPNLFVPPRKRQKSKM